MSAAKILAALLVALALAGVAYRTGAVHERNAQAAAQAEAQRQAAAKVAAAEAIGDGAVANYVTEHFQAEARHAELENRNRQLAARVGLVASLPAVDHVRAAAPACGQPAPQAGAVVADAPAPAPADPELSHRAVWVWNSALTGEDRPSGACGLAGGAAAADAACAAPSGVSLEDAWANHQLNARACAADRARYRALIDVLRRQAVVMEAAP